MFRSRRAKPSTHLHDRGYGSFNAKPKASKPEAKKVPISVQRASQNRRSPRARTMDAKRKAARTYSQPVTEEQYERWVRNPGRYDLEGIDSPAEIPEERPVSQGTAPATRKATAAPVKKKPALSRRRAPAEAERPQDGTISGARLNRIVSMLSPLDTTIKSDGNQISVIDVAHVAMITAESSDNPFGIPETRGGLWLDWSDIRFDDRSFYKASVTPNGVVYSSPGGAT